MAENIALEKSSQKLFTHAVKNIKQLIKSGEINVKKVGDVQLAQPAVKKSVHKIKVYPDRGVVYLSHIPHGFYEDQMKEFFGQFGHVTRLRLSRSHKTGKSRGFAFIEFRFTEVAKVVAETMDNYLMGNRLLKAKYIPPEEQNPKTFLHSKGYGPETCIGLKNRKRFIRSQNKKLSPADTQKRVERQKTNLTKLQERLRSQGVDFVFQVDNGTSERLSQDHSNAASKQPTQQMGKTKKVSSMSAPAKKSVKRTSSDALPGKVAQPIKKAKTVKEVKTNGKKAEKNVVKTPALPEKKSVGKKVVVKKTAMKKASAKPAGGKKDVKKLMKSK